MHESPHARSSADALAASPTDPVTALRPIDSALADELGAWLHAHGWRTTNYDPGSAAIIERPGIVTRLLLQPTDRADATVAADAEASALDRLNGADRARFAAALQRARRAYPVREENVALTDNVPCGILRRWVLEAGVRLVGRGRLPRVDDAVYCTADELVAALSGGDDALAPLASLRRNEQAWVRAHPGPAVVGPSGDLPDLRYLPKHGRQMNEAVLWGMKMEFPGEVAASDGEDLRGSPASPGHYTGRVRVVRKESDFASLLPGEVLVCPTASPSWTILFGIAGALVTDGGGPLAHAAIVAREHSLPAVVGTVNATSRLTDGQLVTIDGTAGTVTIHPAVGQVVQASVSSRDDADSLPGGLPDGRSRRSAGLGSPPARRHEPDRRDHKGDDHRNGEEAGGARDLDGIGARWAVVLQVLEQEGDDRDQPQEAADQDDDDGPGPSGRGSSAMRRGDRMTPVLPGRPVPPSQLAGGRWVGVPARKGGGRRGVDDVRRRARYGSPEPSPAERPRHDGEFVTPAGGRARPRPPG